MIKAVMAQRGRKLLLIGLSHANLDRLRADGLNGFIRIDGPVIGISHDIMITAGSTEAEIADALSDMIGPDTKIHVDPRLKS